MNKIAGIELPPVTSRGLGTGVDDALAIVGYSTFSVDALFERASDVPIDALENLLAKNAGDPLTQEHINIQSGKINKLWDEHYLPAPMGFKNEAFYSRAVGVWGKYTTEVTLRPDLRVSELNPKEQSPLAEKLINRGMMEPSSAEPLYPKLAQRGKYDQNPFDQEQWGSDNAEKHRQFFQIDSAQGMFAVNLARNQAKLDDRHKKQQILSDLRESVYSHMPGELRKIERLKAWLDYRIEQDLERAKLYMKVVAPYDYDALPTPPFDRRWLLTAKQEEMYMVIAQEIKDSELLISEVNKRLFRAGCKYDYHTSSRFSPTDMRIILGIFTLGLNEVYRRGKQKNIGAVTSV